MLSPLNKFRHSRPSMIWLQSTFPHSQTPIPTAYTHTSACKCMHLHAHTHTRAHARACTHTKIVAIYSTFLSRVMCILGHLSAFCPCTQHSACIIMGKEQMLIKLKAVSLGTYFWGIHLSQSYPHHKGP